MKAVAPALAPIFRSRVQANLLSLLYFNIDREYSLTAAAHHIGASLKAVHDEANRLGGAGYLRERREGNVRLIRAGEGPQVRALTELLATSYGPRPVLERLLEDVHGIVRAFIYGSWAARYSGIEGPPPGDIDVLVVGSPKLQVLNDLARNAEAILGREVNIFRITEETWTEGQDGFITHVRAHPRIEMHLKESARTA